jgi:hypothetical protein
MSAVQWAAVSSLARYRLTDRTRPTDANELRGADSPSRRLVRQHVVA